MSKFCEGLEPPYYAVIFAAQRSSKGLGYPQMAASMMELAAKQDGYLGMEHARDADGFGITISYWRDEESIAAWRKQAGHAKAQSLGREQWYSHYELRVSKVERAYSGPEGRG